MTQPVAHDNLLARIKKVRLKEGTLLEGRAIVNSRNAVLGLFYLCDEKLICLYTPYGEAPTCDSPDFEVIRAPVDVIAKNWGDSCDIMARSLRSCGAPVPEALNGTKHAMAAAIGQLKLPRHYRFVAWDVKKHLVYEIDRRGMIYVPPYSVGSGERLYFSDKQDVAAMTLITDNPFQSCELIWDTV